jgi:hypothetical protein
MPAAVTSIAAGDLVDVKPSNAKNKRQISIDNILKALPLAPVGLSSGAPTAAAGTTTADAGVLPAATAQFYPTTAADGTKGVRVHANDKVTGRILVVGNGAAAVLKVYAPSGGVINNAAADAAFSTGSGKGAILVCTDAAANKWLAWS